MDCIPEIKTLRSQAYALVNNTAKLSQPDRYIKASELKHEIDFIVRLTGWKGGYWKTKQLKETIKWLDDEVLSLY